jgi:hypothetical protein
MHIAIISFRCRFFVARVPQSGLADAEIAKLAPARLGQIAGFAPSSIPPGIYFTNSCRVAA